MTRIAARRRLMLAGAAVGVLSLALAALPASAAKRPPRMTGKASVVTSEGVPVRYQFQLFCTPTAGRNTLVVDWASNHFELTSVETELCDDTPPFGRPRSFDTSRGTGFGVLNGQPGAPIRWEFIDDPGQNGIFNGDFALMEIQSPQGGPFPLFVGTTVRRGAHVAHR